MFACVRVALNNAYRNRNSESVRVLQAIQRAWCVVFISNFPHVSWSRTCYIYIYYINRSLLRVLCPFCSFFCYWYMVGSDIGHMVEHKTSKALSYSDVVI